MSGFILVTFSNNAAQRSIGELLSITHIDNARHAMGMVAREADASLTKQ